MNFPCICSPFTEANMSDSIHLTVWNYTGFSIVNQLVSGLFFSGNNSHTEMTMKEIIDAGKRASKKLATTIIPIKVSALMCQLNFVELLVTTN